MLADLKPKSSPIKPSKRPGIDTAANTSYSASAVPGQEEAQRPLQQPMQSRPHSSSTACEIQPAEDQPDSIVGHDIPMSQANDAANQWNQGHTEAGQASWFQSGHDWVAATSSQLASKANALWNDEVGCKALRDLHLKHDMLERHASAFMSWFQMLKLLETFLPQDRVSMLSLHCTITRLRSQLLAHGCKAVEVGGFEMTSTQLVGATAVAALLSIAAVAERKALKRYSR